MTLLRHPLFGLTVYAIAMACVEAALVVYLRELYYPEHPGVILPLRLLSEAHLTIEWVREAATVVMIGSVAFLAVRGALPVFAAFVYVFGLWDIFYYAWLKLTIGWPISWSEWDVLFLIPWPWFGPWLTPVAIAVLFVTWGGAVLAAPRAVRFTPVSVGLFVPGTGLALAAFLAPAWPLLPGGAAAFHDYVPATFAWALYLPGWALMAAGLSLTFIQEDRP